MSHESDSVSRHRNMLKSLRVDIPHVGACCPQLDSCDSLRAGILQLESEEASLPYFTHYWESEQVEKQMAMARRLPLNHTAGNLFRVRGVGADDAIYVINLLGGDVRVVSRLIVDQVVDRSAAQSILGTRNLWHATDHVIALSTGATIPREDTWLSRRQLQAVKFIMADGTVTGVKFNRRGRPDPNGLRGVRALTRSTALLFEARLSNTLTSSPPRRKPIPLGVPYVRAQGGINATPRAIVADWDALDKATRAHADTQNELESVVRRSGCPTFGPGPGDPPFDLGWMCSRGLVIAEVKSTTTRNHRQQVRLGLGQVLDYRHRLTFSSEPVLAVLATSTTTTAEERSFCSAVGVVVASRGGFASDLARLLTPPRRRA